ncbi:sialate O-acetylesterase [Paraflavitalea sp. CAU 1676]|uniref:sialate O-acetylesterase n=1 Tax=Paraflavitalea sp. CAU 1676 TaxID=3032598 RepID=UPI0023DBA06C|nr:sialate O-acetylesterase [Paraflavitalea sp. CAU 1676]MDF2188742.1 sialate O-acetylesterase [Paraflavitalea sp. CAU 1676]
MKQTITIACLLIGITCTGQLQLARIFSSHMVLQRDQPIHVWGQARPADTVTARLGHEEKKASADADGHWSVYFHPRKASGQPLHLSIGTATEHIDLVDLVIGDLWVCIGQSNMEWPMAKELHYHEARGEARRHLVRFYNPTYAGKNIYGSAFTDSVVQRLTPDRFYEGSWLVSDTGSIATMSAVAWYFGKTVAYKMKIPIGLIHLAIGGAPLETFIDAKALQSSSPFKAKVRGNWLDNESLPVWVRERGRQNTGRVTTIPVDENGPAHAYKPGFAYTAGIAPIIPMPIKGILCYQGESNAQEKERVAEYASLSSLLVAGYRRQWQQPKLPFYFVQLSSIDTIKYKGHWWPQFRNEQRKMLTVIPYSGMAVSSDSGARHDVHPTNKKIVGERLARWALRNTYGQSVTPSGPLPLQAVYRNGQVVISFHYGAGLQTADGQTLRGFSTNGVNDTPAKIQQQTVRISTPAKPAYVYYGWRSYTDANLVNVDLLPASTFRIKVN